MENIFGEDDENSEEMARIIGKLWQKENSGLYVDLGEMQWPIDVRPAAVKSNTVADMHRSAGNGLFGQKKWIEAMDKYNQSLCYAEKGAESLSIAYANRSSCFLHLQKYDNCLHDIELATKANYPERLMPKLMQRKADCLSMKAADTRIRPREVTLSYDESTTIPGMTDILEFKRNSKYGRYVVAKRGIPVGKTILIEPYFTSFTMSDDSHCQDCQATQCNLIPCEHCTMAMFCSAACLERGSIYHNMECGYRIFGKCENSYIGRQILHTIFLGLDACQGVDGLMDFVESVRIQLPGIPTSLNDPLSRYRAFLHTNVYEFLNTQIGAAIAKYVFQTMTVVPKMAELLLNTLAKKRFFMHLILMHLIRLRANQSKGNIYQGNNIHGLGLAFAMFNHSCVPNVFYIVNGGRNVCITSLPIRRGDQLFVSYSRSGEHQNQRKQGLFEHYGFWCECTMCQPVVLAKYQILLMERDEDLVAMLLQNAVEDVITSVKENSLKRMRIMKLCINFLNKHGHLPHNEHLELVMSTLWTCISCNFDS